MKRWLYPKEEPGIYVKCRKHLRGIKKTLGKKGLSVYRTSQ